MHFGNDEDELNDMKDERQQLDTLCENEIVDVEQIMMVDKSFDIVQVLNTKNKGMKKRQYISGIIQASGDQPSKD